MGLYAFVAFTPRASFQELKKYVSAIKYLSVYIVVFFFEIYFKVLFVLLEGSYRIMQ